MIFNSGLGMTVQMDEMNRSFGGMDDVEMQGTIDASFKDLVNLSGDNHDGESRH